MVYIGTSGFKYPEWKGKFYPEKIIPADMLPFYATRFNTTEVNYTFYRMPTRMLLENWRKDVGPDFAFSFKAPRRITHDAQLRNVKAITLDFLRICRTVENQLGAFLFQLPPSLEKDFPLLEDFLEVFPDDIKVAFEFRHPSWFSDDLFHLLKEKNIALCIADSEKISTPIEITSDFAYFRLRNEKYQRPDLERWAGEIAKCPGDVFVYLKHEESGIGPQFAQQLKELLAEELLLKH